MSSPDSELSVVDENQSSIVEKTFDVPTVLDTFDCFIRDDDGIKLVVKKMTELGIDIEAVRKRVNYDLHPRWKAEERPDRTRHLSPLGIVYLHLHEYTMTLIKCLELLESGKSDVAIFHEDRTLRKAAMGFAQRLTSGTPSNTLLNLLIIYTDLHVLRSMEESEAANHY